MENTTDTFEETEELTRSSEHEANSKGYINIQGAASKQGVPEEKTAEVEGIAHVMWVCSCNRSISATSPGEGGWTVAMVKMCDNIREDRSFEKQSESEKKGGSWGLTSEKPAYGE